MTKSMKEKIEITLTLKQACGLAIPAMLQTQQPKITVADQGEEVLICAEFAADQNITLMLHNDLLVGGSITFKIGRQPTLAALKALETAGFTPLVFDLTALGEGVLKTCAIRSSALPIALGDLYQLGSSLVADLLTRLLATDVDHDGVTDHCLLAQRVLTRYLDLIEPGAVGTQLQREGKFALMTHGMTPAAAAAARAAQRAS